MKKYYEKGATYTLPAGDIHAFYIDGIYIDGDLFENSIPLLDATLHVRVSPDKGHDAFLRFDVRLPVFVNGIVEFYPGYVTWLLQEGGEKSFDIASNGNPYGHGLYSLGVSLNLTVIPITRPVYFYVAYQMEVDI